MRKYCKNLIGLKFLGEIMVKFEDLIDTFLKEYDIDIRVLKDMPQGYENGFGTFDPEKNTLFFNESLLKQKPWLGTFVIFHELRHALQYLRKGLVGDDVTKYLDYVVLYNGDCFKRNGDGYLQTKICGDAEFLKNVYLSFPYELDANEFALDKCKSILNKADFEKLSDFYERNLRPTKTISKEEIEEITKSIDQNLKDKR